jgi:hypothetical protein
VDGSCEQGTEPSGSIYVGKFLGSCITGGFGVGEEMGIGLECENLVIENFQLIHTTGNNTPDNQGALPNIRKGY